MNIKSLKTKKGESGGMGAIALVVLSITMIIGTIVFFNIWNMLNATQGSNRIINNTLQNVSALFGSGIQLLSVGLIIIPAAVVLGYVFLIRG